MEKNKLLLTLTIIATILFGCLLANILYERHKISKRGKIGDSFFETCIDACKWSHQRSWSVLDLPSCSKLMELNISLGLCKRFPSLFKEKCQEEFKNLATLEKMKKDLEKQCQEEKIERQKMEEKMEEEIQEKCKKYCSHLNIKTYVCSILFFISLGLLIYQLKKTKHS